MKKLYKYYIMSVRKGFKDEGEVLAVSPSQARLMYCSKQGLNKGFDSVITRMEIKKEDGKYYYIEPANYLFHQEKKVVKEARRQRKLMLELEMEEPIDQIPMDIPEVSADYAFEENNNNGDEE